VCRALREANCYRLIGWVVRGEPAPDLSEEAEMAALRAALRALDGDHDDPTWSGPLTPDQRRELRDLRRRVARAAQDRLRQFGPQDDERSLFLDFPPKERLLLTALWNKGAVSDAKVQRAVWPGRLPREPHDTLHKLKTRVNRKLAAKDYNLEVKREGRTLKLVPVDDNRPPFPRRE
jgi:hypothetical protein